MDKESCLGVVEEGGNSWRNVNVNPCEKCVKLEREIQQLKRRRAEDGRANERVVSIYAAQQQRWFSESKSLRQQIGGLLNHLRILDATTKLQEMELQAGENKKQVEERLKATEALVEDLRESAKQEARIHASELWKHKSALMELVSSQRQLEAELGRARRRAETAKHQLDFMLSKARRKHSDDECLAETDEEFADVKQVDGWVCLRAGEYKTPTIEQKHQQEVQAFSDQIRLKDEKLEAYHWRSLDMELESKRLLSQIEALTQSKLHLETLLVERDMELKSLKDSICMKQCSVEDPQGLVLACEEEEAGHPEVIEIMQKDPLIKERSFWKMDIQALGVSYKIKRLKQQLVMLERLKGKQEFAESSETEDNDHIRMQGFHVLLVLLNKQVARYDSLQQKTDDLCKRMRDKELDANKGGSNSMRTKEESTTLEQFLEESFQLQRFIVAAGQKLTEIHSKIKSGFIAVADHFDGPTSFGMTRFSDNLQSVFREVQRGIEVRIARIIGDVEGTLACDGIRFSRQ